MGDRLSQLGEPKKKKQKIEKPEIKNQGSSSSRSRYDASRLPPSGIDGQSQGLSPAMQSLRDISVQVMDESRQDLSNIAHHWDNEERKQIKEQQTATDEETTAPKTRPGKRSYFAIASSEEEDKAKTVHLVKPGDSDQPGKSKKQSLLPEVDQLVASLSKHHPDTAEPKFQKEEEELDELKKTGILERISLEDIGRTMPSLFKRAETKTQNKKFTKEKEQKVISNLKEAYQSIIKELEDKHSKASRALIIEGYLRNDNNNKDREVINNAKYYIIDITIKWRSLAEERKAKTDHLVKPGGSDQPETGKDPSLRDRSPSAMSTENIKITPTATDKGKGRASDPELEEGKRPEGSQQQERKEIKLMGATIRL